MDYRIDIVFRYVVMSIETLLAKEALKEVGFTRRQIILLLFILSAIWGIGGYIFGKVEVLNLVQMKMAKGRKKELKSIERKRVEFDRSIVSTAFGVTDKIDLELLTLKRLVLKNNRLPAANNAEPLRQLQDKIK